MGFMNEYPTTLKFLLGGHCTKTQVPESYTLNEWMNVLLQSLLPRFQTVFFKQVMVYWISGAQYSI